MTEWYIREYRCDNGICYKTKFPVRVSSADEKSYAKKKAAVSRAEKGAREAGHEAARLSNCNFAAGRDAYVGLDYSDEGYDRLIARAGTDERDAVYAAADRECANFIRRVRRECDKRGIELRYWYVTSDQDGQTFDEVRAHHHMMVCAEAAEICREKWTAGGSYIRTLWGPDHGDLTAIAEYMVGQVRYIAGNKRYTPSRNLKKAAAGRPVKARRAEAELCVPRGCQQLWRSEYRRGVPQHIRYYRPPELMPAFPDDE
jgi:hypothetical protein